jgi:Ser/Thr protein kinase RdoA (MazF antagonist)
MYLGGPQEASAFLSTYRVLGPLGDEEMDRLDAFRRLRWVVQAVYFARRLSARDLTGIADDSENQKGLDDARRGLADLGLPTV